MQIHSLEFQGIGPFPGRHRIDVDRLAASGIFLLEGPTGSGKSTIIDAVVFALYGGVATEAGHKDRLRSAHVDPEVETYVDLVFSVQSGDYRVRRSPEYMRPKRRGTGQAKEQAQVNLWRLSSLPEVGPEASIEEYGDALAAVSGVALSTRLGRPTSSCGTR
ncbi:hypothetical protein GCM10025865_15190 [Paraoerskovia sediminicola]|uniref:Nuclease SbcCD subunit C n=1 Tax=Paraoerskovia sediminicola TaxID=1138587 RepID=A0ABN6XC20_9CELL|nr:AAA family ATPase [Paraoerskovia sediminicola]BDZ42220.1 hypothetical protein GCM10025865_15190 [Paraoerskovia sediminicola]